MINVNSTKLSRSDQAKPYIEAIRQILSIDDELKQLRKEWIFGRFQLEEHKPNDSVGLYGMTGP